MTDTDHPTAEDYRNKAERAEQALAEATGKIDAILLPVNNELGNMIVRAWLKLHITYAQDSYDTAIHPEDRDAALADLHAFNQVLTYVGEEND